MSTVLKVLFSRELWQFVARLLGLLFLLYLLGIATWRALTWMETWPDWAGKVVGYSIIVPCVIYYVVWQWKEWPRD